MRKNSGGGGLLMTVPLVELLFHGMLFLYVSLSCIRVLDSPDSSFRFLFIIIRLVCSTPL